MGRSKFPGKPSKHINRKRVNVLPPTGEQCNVDDQVTVTENKQVVEQNDSVTPCSAPNSTFNTKMSLKRRLNRKIQNSKALRAKASKRNLITKMCNKSGLKTAMNNSQIKRTRKIAHYASIKNLSRNAQKESNNLGKFILPSRSVHSSRVIKPNKRFISVDMSDSLSHKQKILNKRRIIEVESSPKSQLGNDSGQFHNALHDTTSGSNGKVVLRQPRLQIQTKTHIGPEGPFSSSTTNNSPPGTVTCGVCGAVRFYRFVKQARKFNIYSCESCRKFISKMIKRQSCGKGSGATLVCHKGQGMCHVPPIVRSQQWKLIRCAYRARCPACWLKMCLRSFQMPMSLKNSLSKLLPQNMQVPDSLFSNSLPSLWQPKSEDLKKQIEIQEPSISSKQRPVRVPKATPQATLSVSTDIKRQKIDLKGPRVKHVCRSASIVLGQPVATFNEAVKKKSENHDECKDQQIEDKPSSADSSIEKQIVTSKETKSDVTVSESESNESEKSRFSLLNEISVSSLRRDRSQRNLINTSYENKEKTKPQNEMQHVISIDFWENYDPEDVSQNGFSLIASEPFPMQGICFLCGSGGREALLHCCLCCEPYHPFCLEQNLLLENNNIEQSLWLCPRCTTCSACNMSDRTKINCQKCYKAYHPECFNVKWCSEDRPTVCSKCLRCRSCGAENITKFVGNLPLCITCFKLRKKGNFCPLCQKCYDENDYYSKMMECAVCKKWVHSKCEGLLEEQYQILSLLPENIEYICKLCSKHTTPYWRKAVDMELKASFSNVLRMLSKNKIARNMLKWSPLNNNNNNNSSSLPMKNSSIIRRLQFSDEENSNLDAQSSRESNVATGKDVSFSGNDTKACSRTMVDIKSKLNSNEYHSVREYNAEMEAALNYTQSDQLMKIYRSILHKVFPWYEVSETENQDVFENSFLEEDSTGIQQKTKDNPPYQTSFLLENDTRICAFCKGVGDGLSHQESRLLYCGQNEWVHANCALWSSEVYEEIDGSLQNVHSALSRGRLMRCSLCKQKGASVGCCHKGCYETYHFSCAQKVSCVFMHDKTVFCAVHELPKSSHPITSSQEFDLRRSVYVELDKKKGKFCEIEKVNFMVGSLCVTNLGKINPSLSDGYEAIIPTGFVCSRLFWSTVEPWKLVSYQITTSAFSAHMNTLYVDKNFTVDHTMPKDAVDKKMREICSWQKDLNKKKAEIVDIEDEEEPQNGADLLSPELTDAILKELPHDLLDGISVQDIFPKFMPCEDLVNLDFKAELNAELNDFRKCEMQDFGMTDNLDLKSNRELKRSKSEVVFNIDKLSKERTQSRSCSVTLSCKLDRSLSPVMKKRKIVPPRENNFCFQLLQVDGNFDDSSSSECDSPTREVEANPWVAVSEEPVTCTKCQSTYRTQASYKRHLDSCELLCTSESDSELGQDGENNTCFRESTTVAQMQSMDTTPVVISVAENNPPNPLMVSSYESYQNEIHTSVLNTQTFVSSKSSSEVISVPQTTSDILLSSLPTQMEQKAVIPTIVSNQCNVPVNTVAPISINLNQQPVITETTPSEQQFTISQPSMAINESISISNSPYCVNQGVPLCVNQPVTIQPNTISMNPSIINNTSSILNQAIAINQINPTQTIHQPLEIQQPVTIQQVPFASNVNHPVINVNPQNQISLNGKIISNPNILNSVVTQTVNVPTSQWIKSISKPTVINEKSIRPRGRGRPVLSKKPHFGENETLLIPSQNPSTPSVIVQHLPSTSFVPAFVDTFQQQTGQNLQYIATITPQINQTIPTQPIVQIQPENNIISLVPGVQSAMIIQQPRMFENQLVLDSNGTLSWSSQPIQPVYYGFETIVQNTVMQSQQFLPTTVPGVLTANSSYSTTTQVFQTSKLEPVLDVSSNSFVLVNPVNTGQLIATSQPSIEVSQYSQPTKTVANAALTTNIKPTQQSQPISQAVKVQSLPVSQKITLNNGNYNSITLPTAPFVSEQGIPTNIVTPTPKPSTSVQSRPMSRVLPMQTQIIKDKPSPPVFKPVPEVTKLPTEVQEVVPEIQKIIPAVQKIIPEIQKLLPEIQKPMPEIKKPTIEVQKVTTETYKPPLEIILHEKLQMDVEKPAIDSNIKFILDEKRNVEPTFEKISDFDNLLKSKRNEIEKEVSVNPSQKENIEVAKADSPLKLIFQKQSGDGTYKISNNFDKMNGSFDKMCSNIDKIGNNFEKINSNFEKLSNNFDKISNNFVPKNTSVQVAPLKPIKSNNTSSVPSRPPQTQNENKVPRTQSPLTQINNKLSENFARTEKKPEKKLSTTYSDPKINHLQTQEKKNNDNPSILYTIETQDGFRYSSNSVSELWNKVFETVQNARAAHNMPPLPTNSQNIMNSLHLLGLKNNGLKYLIEQLPGVAKCSKYKPVHHFPTSQVDSDDDYSSRHIFGAIRCSPYSKRYNQYDMFGWLSSKHRRPESSLMEMEILPRRGSITNLPMAMRFRQLKLTSKYSVGVYRSSIHGRGLFCLRDIEAGEMVIEYAGEVIRSVLCDKREKEYNKKGIGCYMFRIDDNLVVDATMKGNAARFINHSCDPNCYSKVVEILGHKHIIIFALRRILYSEELTYDYKFPFEEDKIPCTCGTRRCRKFLN